MKERTSAFIPKKLACLRIASKLTQNKLADALNISRSCLANYETGKRTPDDEILGIISEYFNVSKEYFFQKNEKMICEGKISTVTRELLETVSGTGKLDISNLSPISKLALIELYDFLQQQDKPFENL